MPHVRTTHRFHRLPDQITVHHGPTEFLARYFLEMDKQAKSKGIYLSLSDDMRVLNKVKGQNPSLQLAPLFNPRYGGANQYNSFCLIGLNESQEVVATQAARFYEFHSTSLAEAIQSLLLFYPVPAEQAWPGEYCSVTAQMAQTITGRIVYSGNTWARADYRGRDIASLLPRISRAIALTRWNTDFTISMVQKILVEKGIAQRYGYSNIEDGIIWNRVEIGELLKFALVWMNQQECIQDMRHFLGRSSSSDLQLSSTERNIDVGLQ